MKRKSIYVGLGLLLGLAGLGSVAGLLVLHEPGYYHQAAQEAGPQRVQRSRDFLSAFWLLVNEILNSREGAVEFTEQQINSYFEEDFRRNGVARKLPAKIDSPRVRITPNHLRLGFRYGQGFWSTIIGVDFRVWLVGAEPNVVALEIQGVRAGAVPISAQSLLEKVTESAPQNMEIAWYRYNGHPVALVRFQADRKRPTMQLRHLELHEGKLVVAGGPLEGTSPRAVVTSPDD